MYGSIFYNVVLFSVAVFLNNIFFIYTRDNGTYILLAGWEIPMVNQSGYEPLNLEKQL